jgi:hypothetical protein
MAMSPKRSSRRFVAYYRVSTDRQGRSGLGLEAQQSSVRNYLNGGEWELIGEFTEIESGKHADRPELVKALEVCRRQKARLVIAKLDRLSRNLAFIATLMDSGVEFLAVDNPHANGSYPGRRCPARAGDDFRAHAERPTGGESPRKEAWQSEGEGGRGVGQRRYPGHGQEVCSKRFASHSRNSGGWHQKQRRYCRQAERAPRADSSGWSLDPRSGASRHWQELVGKRLVVGQFK